MQSDLYKWTEKKSREEQWNSYETEGSALD